MDPRIEREKATLQQMISLYCRRKEKNTALCEDCRQLQEYALKRLDACRYGNTKKSCKKCPTPCYAKRYREKIRRVMRYAGPRLIAFHPLEAIRHLLNR